MAYAGSIVNESAERYRRGLPQFVENSSQRVEYRLADEPAESRDGVERPQLG